MQTYAFPKFTQSQVSAMPKGPSTLEAVVKEWDPKKVAWHALHASDPSGYILQSVYLASLSLIATGASDDQIVGHIESIYDEYNKMLSPTPVMGSA